MSFFGEDQITYSTLIPDVVDDLGFRVLDNQDVWWWAGSGTPMPMNWSMRWYVEAGSEALRQTRAVQELDPGDMVADSLETQLDRLTMALYDKQEVLSIFPPKRWVGSALRWREPSDRPVYVIPARVALSLSSNRWELELMRFNADGGFAEIGKVTAREMRGEGSRVGQMVMACADWEKEELRWGFLSQGTEMGWDGVFGGDPDVGGGSSLVPRIPQWFGFGGGRRGSDDLDPPPHEDPGQQEPVTVEYAGQTLWRDRAYTRVPRARTLLIYATNNEGSADFLNPDAVKLAVFDIDPAGYGALPTMTGQEWADSADGNFEFILGQEYRLRAMTFDLNTGDRWKVWTANNLTLSVDDPGILTGTPGSDTDSPGLFYRTNTNAVYAGGNDFLGAPSVIDNGVYAKLGDLNKEELQNVGGSTDESEYINAAGLPGLMRLIGRTVTSPPADSRFNWTTGSNRYYVGIKDDAVTLISPTPFDFGEETTEGCTFEGTSVTVQDGLGESPEYEVYHPVLEKMVKVPIQQTTLEAEDEENICSGNVKATEFRYEEYEECDCSDFEGDSFQIEWPTNWTFTYAQGSFDGTLLAGDYTISAGTYKQTDNTLHDTTISQYCIGTVEIYMDVSGVFGTLVYEPSSDCWVLYIDTEGTTLIVEYERCGECSPYGEYTKVTEGGTVSGDPAPPTITITVSNP